MTLNVAFRIASGPMTSDWHARVRLCVILLRMVFGSQRRFDKASCKAAACWKRARELFRLGPRPRRNYVNTSSSTPGATLQSYALPCGPAGKCRGPMHRRGGSATDRASAIASVSSPQVTDWTDPYPARPTRPRGNAVSRYPAGRAPAVANPGSSCPKARIAEVNRIRSPSLAASRSRIFTRDTSIGPIPVWTARSGR